MKDYLSQASCNGLWPSRHNPGNIHSRPDLVSRLMAERHAPRFIVAPSGFGKTTLSLEYAYLVFSLQGVVFLDAQSPCFLRYLDEGNFFGKLHYAHPAMQLVIIDELPMLSPARTAHFVEMLNRFLEADCEVIVNLSPGAFTFAQRFPDAGILRAADLLLTDSELSEIVPDETYVAMAKRDIGTLDRIPGLIHRPQQFGQALLKFLSRENVNETLRLALFGALMCRCGKLSTVSALLARANTAREFRPASSIAEPATHSEPMPEHLTPYDDAEQCATVEEHNEANAVLTALSFDYPFITLNVDADTFTCFSLPAADLVRAFSHDSTAFANLLALDNFDTLLSRLATMALQDGDVARSCEIAHTISRSPVRQQWLAEHDADFNRRLWFEGPCTLYESLSPTRSQTMMQLTATQAWRLAVLNNTAQALDCANYVASAQRSGVAQKVYALALIERYGSEGQAEIARATLHRLCQEEHGFLLPPERDAQTTPEDTLQSHNNDAERVQAAGAADPADTTDTAAETGTPAAAVAAQVPTGRAANPDNERAPLWALASFSVAGEKPWDVRHYLWSKWKEYFQRTSRHAAASDVLCAGAICLLDDAANLPEDEKPIVLLVQLRDYLTHAYEQLTTNPQPTDLLRRFYVGVALQNSEANKLPDFQFSREQARELFRTKESLVLQQANIIDYSRRRTSVPDTLLREPAVDTPEEQAGLVYAAHAGTHAPYEALDAYASAPEHVSVTYAASSFAPELKTTRADKNASSAGIILTPDFPRFVTPGDDDSFSQPPMTQFSGDTHHNTSHLELHNVPQLKVWLFGKLEVQQNGYRYDFESVQRQKVKTLLAIFVLNAGRELTRETLAEMLWPDSFADARKRNYYSIWSILNRDLRTNGRHNPYIVHANYGYRLVADYLWSDVKCVEDLCKSLALPQHSVEEKLRLLAELNDLYRGELLPSEVSCTVIVEAREYYHNLVVDCLVQTASDLINAGSTSAALKFIQTAYRLERKREDIYIVLMRIQVACGMRTQALETYTLCRRFLARTLGLNPSPELIKLYNTLMQSETTMEA